MKPVLNTICPDSLKLTDTEALLDRLNLGIFRFSPGMCLEYFNPAAGVILGIKDKDLWNFNTLIPQLDIISEDGVSYKLEDLPFYKVVRTGFPAAQEVLGIFNPFKKERRWLQVNAEPIFKTDGSIREIVASFSDITSQKAANDQLNTLYRHLEIRAMELSAVNSDLEKFIYAATHDLQEPLRLITGFLQLLATKYEHDLDEQGKLYVRYAVEGAGRMKKLILDLLEYSSLSASGMRMVPVDMNEVLKVSSKTLSRQLKDCRATLILHPLPVVIVYPPLMAQLFENIIENALKFKSDSEPRIEIHCQEQDHFWLFSIQDNGIGMVDKNTNKIFDLFHRLNTDALYEGTGAGLAICQKIVSIHRGKIWVESAAGNGSTFYLTIPKSEWQNEKI